MSIILLDKNKHIHLKTVDSTNNYISNIEIPSGTWVTAEEQVAGRGRRENIWHAVGSHRIIFSGKIEWKESQTNFLPLSILTAGAILKSIFKTFPNLVESILVKWPNDIYTNSKKCGGILIESQFIEDRAIFIIGIGLNLYGKEIPSNIANKAGFLLGEKLSEGKEVIFLNNLLDSINEVVLSLMYEKMVLSQIEWIYNHSILKGKGVRFQNNGTADTGTVIGYDSNGFLKVRTKKEIIHLMDTDPFFEVLN